MSCLTKETQMTIFDWIENNPIEDRVGVIEKKITTLEQEIEKMKKTTQTKKNPYEMTENPYHEPVKKKRKLRKNNDTATASGEIVSMKMPEMLSIPNQPEWVHVNLRLSIKCEIVNA